ncbi:uncharacterized protein A1O5_02789 [Cladophialophora psammophila CBS 110553]|uniref:Uncharacterized protein n=1 Tax=Cladophialophora psammophila CBS 110553 TaxID=1182543 RepID=W9X2T7_9EURO|nr:uncharacterized protein A1O5_02789 [Cladophialophora psammophila CBS 110553]EXJ74493.1 hypothetical protein A1O5_02789 [Cladophialophora psammophila CBS 110553]
MRIREIYAFWGLGLLLSSKLLVTALPTFDYMWSHVRTEHIYSSSDDCDPAKEACFWPGFFHLAIESNEESDPAVRVPAAVYPHDTTLTATATDDNTATSCTPSAQAAVTTVPDLKFQRRDEDTGVIPPAIQSQETTLPPANPTPYPCAGVIQPCAPGYKVLLFNGMCICYYLGGRGDEAR